MFALQVLGDAAKSNVRVLAALQNMARGSQQRGFASQTTSTPESINFTIIPDYQCIMCYKMKVMY